MPYELFPHLNPRRMRDFEEAFEMKRKFQDEQNYILGKYFMSALSATVGNMFLKSTDKKIEYIKMPILQYDEELVRKHEIEEQRKAFMQSLINAQAEFEANKKLQGDSVS